MFSLKLFRGLLSLTLCLLMLLGLSSAGAQSETAALLYNTNVSAMEDQDAVDAALLTEAAFGYTFESPFCLVNPYGTVPLSAVIIFDTAEETSVTMTVKGHAAEDDVVAEFPAATRHILPVVGLYANEANTVELALPDGSVSVVTVETGSVGIETLLNGEVTVPAADGYDFSELTFLSVGNTQCVVAYDSKGDLRYYAEFKAKKTTPLRQLANGHYLVASNNTANETEANGGIMEVDLTGRIYNLYQLPGGFHHDMMELPNGNFIVVSSQDDLTVIMDTMVEIDRTTGDIVWKLDLSDIMDSADGSGTLYRETDWSHTNGVDYDAATDTVLLSCRALDAVVAVNHETLAISWILGTSEGWTNTDLALFFTPVEGQEDFEWNYAQHNATFLDSTHILMFDNGTNRYKTVTAEDQRNTGLYSRAVLYQIDPEGMTIAQEWSYGKDLGLTWYSNRFCGVNYDADADVYWICSGTTNYDTETQDYIANAREAENPDAVVTLSHIDMVRGDALLYELNVQAAGYRAVRFNPYAYPAALDLETPGTAYSYTPAE